MRREFFKQMLSTANILFILFLTQTASSLKFKVVKVKSNGQQSLLKTGGMKRSSMRNKRNSW